MQQLHVEAEKETRYDLETVKRAAALAVKLQESRQNSLSQAEVDAMAAEAGIDPVCMRQALHAVRQEQALSLGTQRTVSPRKARASVALAIGAILAVMFFVLGLYSLRSESVAPAAMAAEVLPVAPIPAIATTPTSVDTPLKKNTQKPTKTKKNGTELKWGSTALPGWKVANGRVRYLRLPGTSDGALALGRNGKVEQLIPTVPGASYRLTYEISGEVGPEARLHRETVEAVCTDNSTITQASSAFASGGPAPGNWTQSHMDFQARDVAMRIDLGSKQPADGTNLPILRNIRVEQTSNVQTP